MTQREKELTGLLEQCQQALAESRRENALLRQKIDLLVKRVFGSSNEQLNPAQLELLMGVPESSTVAAPAVPPEKKPSPSPAKKRVLRLPENLPVVEEVIEPEPVKAEPAQWRCIGQEVSEQLDYEPGRFLKRRVVRRKYVHKTNLDCAPVIAALPERLLDRSLPAAGLLPISWWENTATIFLSTGRNRFTSNATASIYRARVWPAGSSWLRTG
jgi:transposase